MMAGMPPSCGPRNGSGTACSSASARNVARPRGDGRNRGGSPATQLRYRLISLAAKPSMECSGRFSSAVTPIPQAPLGTLGERDWHGFLNPLLSNRP